MAVPDPVAAGVRLMSDYYAKWPLWIGDVNVTPAHLGLSAAMAGRLEEWQRCFLTHYTHTNDLGWDSASAREWYAAEAEALFRDLKNEVRPTVLVSVDLWPVPEDDSASTG
jgi:hypothetical protein